MSLPFQVRQSTTKQLYGRQFFTLMESGRMHEQSLTLDRDPNAYEKMFLDATIAHLCQVRKHMVAGSRWQLEPASERHVDVHLTHVLQRILEIGLGNRFAEGRFNLAEAVFRGGSFARMNGRLKWTASLTPDGMPWQVWAPTELIDVDKRRFDKVTHHVDRGLPTERFEVEWRMFDVVHNDWRQWEHPEWYVKHTYNADEASLGYGRGLVDAMYFYWRAKEILLKSGLQGAERWALGFMVASVDNARSASSGKTNQAIVNSFIAELTRQRSQHFFVKDKLDELEVLPGPGQGWEIVQYMLEYCDRNLRQLVLGAHLPTEARGGGSYALAEVQQGTTDVVVKYDRRILSETLSRDLVQFVYDVNHHVIFDMGLASAELPRFEILEDKKEDPKMQAEITEILLRAGLRLKKDETYELVERTMPGPEDETIDPPQMQAGAGGGPGSPIPGQPMRGPGGQLIGRNPNPKPPVGGDGDKDRDRRGRKSEYASALPGGLE